MSRLRKAWAAHPDLWISLLLALAVLLVYQQVRTFQFITYDDALYVTDNPRVLGGLTLASMRWAFTNLEAANWHPLTWLAHMADISMFGNRPGAHHLVNVAWHLANSLLCYHLLRTLTGARWRSALVAALFALHPCHVESVAWIAERKDVLSTCFWLLTTWVYVAQVRRPSRARYGLMLLCFALGLMAKAMLVTLPATLLLLDFWPLRRWTRWREFGACLWEKLPLFLVALTLSVVTFLAQRHGGALNSLAGLPLRLRLPNALLSTVKYLGMAIWPTRLAVFYPFPTARIPLWQQAGAAAILAGLTAVAIWQWRKRPWLLMGWAWYLVTLAPVIGIIQVGGQALADRYTYVPYLGLFIIFAWGAAEAAERLRVPRRALAALAAVGLGVLMLMTARQVSHWRETLTLFRHVSRVTHRNLMAYMNIAYAFEAKGQYPEAAEAYRATSRIAPSYLRPRYGLAQTLERLGRPEEALPIYRAILSQHPEEVEAHCLQGQVLMVLGRDLEAIGEYRLVQEAEPARLGEGSRGRELALASRLNLGILLLRHHAPLEALRSLLSAIRLCPLSAEPLSQTVNHYAALALMDLGQPKEAAKLWRQGLALQPNQPVAWFGLGRALAQAGQREEAIQAYRQVLLLNPGHPGARAAMAAL
jgi:tetratricopeptide (TPR) repeat protein